MTNQPSSTEQTAPATVPDANGQPVLVPDGIPVDAFGAFMAGRVPAQDCPHYIAASEASAGFTTCERC